MRYMLMHKLDEAIPNAYDPTPEFVERMGGFVQEAMNAGVLLAAEGLRPTSEGASRITVSGGRKTVTDGPFIETKELIAGFAMIQVRSHDEAVEWARRFADLFVGYIDDMEIDVRRLAEQPA
ncbi:YciI family protein [Plantactinospora sp. GCM10030261]|uniref:YciI family protein n=1 Tax=Plantactinospora sp. GCM10030261 TaxID=3273420 RepID=UPI00360B5766